MSKRTTFLLLLSLCLIVTVGATGCKKPPVVEPTPPPPPKVEEPAPAPTPPPKVEVNDTFKDAVPEAPVVISPEQLTGKLETVYFAFDKSDLNDTARATIRDNVQVLKDNPGPKVVVEGHCDERGTIEYNLALGERRAKAVRDYMTSLGMDASRIRIISYGEERPAATGHNEAAWSKNRRGVFRAEKG